MPEKSIPREFMLAGLATSCACVFTNPLEVVKTRLQLQGELSQSGKVPYRGVGHAFVTIARNEGVRGIQRGLAPGIAYQVCMNGTRLGLYGPLQSIVGTNASDPLFFVKNVAIGATTGCLGAFLGSPFFLVKTRLQAQTSSAHLAVGHQYGYSGMWSGLRHIYSQGGFTGMWRGANGMVMRVAMGSSVQLSTYDSCKLWVQENVGATGFLSHLLSSMLSGGFVALAMNPLDVVTTRLYNQKVGPDGRGALYTGPIDCLIKTGRAEGIRGLQKGLFAHYCRIGPHTVLTFVFWEKVKQLAEDIGI